VHTLELDGATLELDGARLEDEAMLLEDEDTMLEEETVLDIPKDDEMPPEDKRASLEELLLSKTELLDG